MFTAATHYRVCELVTFQQCPVVNKLNLSGTYQGYKLMHTAVLSGALVVSWQSDQTEAEVIPN